MHLQLPSTLHGMPVPFPSTTAFVLDEHTHAHTSHDIPLHGLAYVRAALARQQPIHLHNTNGTNGTANFPGLTLPTDWWQTPAMWCGILAAASLVGGAWWSWARRGICCCGLGGCCGRTGLESEHGEQDVAAAPLVIWLAIRFLFTVESSRKL